MGEEMKAQNYVICPKSMVVKWLNHYWCLIGFFHYSVLPPVQSTVNSCITQYRAFRVKEIIVFPPHLTGLSRAVHPS